MKLKDITSNLKAEPSEITIYILLYFSVGICMHHFGIWAGIARFTFWWQVITCYILYMIPVSLLLRNRPFHVQYVYGLAAIAPIEFGGYALGTSQALNVAETGNTIINQGNLLISWFDVKNFSLGMAVFFGLYFPAGNGAVSFIRRILGLKKN